MIRRTRMIGRTATLGRRDGRSGKSLLEMIFVVAGISVVLATAGQLLHRVSQVERLVRDSAAVGRAELRLARDFREDVRAAESVVPFTSDDAPGLRIVLPQSTVEYVARDGTVLRTITSEPARREGYRLGSVAVRFGHEEDRFASLTIEPQRTTGRTQTSAGRLQIVAAIGADRAGEQSRSAESRRPVEAARPATQEPT